MQHDEPPAAPRNEKSPSAGPSAPRQTKEREQIRGRVLDPDGQPVKNARLHWPSFRKRIANPEDRLEFVELGRCDDEGRFRVALTAGEDLHDSLRKLVVTAAGYGLNWVELPKGKSAGEVTSLRTSQFAAAFSTRKAGRWLA